MHPQSPQQYQVENQWFAYSFWDDDDYFHFHRSPSSLGTRQIQHAGRIHLLRFPRLIERTSPSSLIFEVDDDWAKWRKTWNEKTGYNKLSKQLESIINLLFLQRVDEPTDLNRSSGIRNVFSVLWESHKLQTKDAYGMMMAAFVFSINREGVAKPTILQRMFAMSSVVFPVCIE